MPQDSSFLARGTEGRGDAEYEMKQTLGCVRSTTPPTPGRGLDLHDGSKDVVAASCHCVAEKGYWAYRHLFEMPTEKRLMKRVISST